MIIILLITLVVLYVINNRRQRYLLSPENIVMISFIIVASVSALNSIIWNIDITLLSYFILISYLLIFVIGFKIGYSVIYSKKKYHLFRAINNSNITIIIITFILIITLIQYFRFIYDLSVWYGNPGRLDLMVSYARSAFTDPNLSIRTPRLLGHLQVFANAVAYIFVYIIINNLHNGKRILSQMKYIPSILLYIGLVFLSGGRTKILYLFIYIIVIALNYRFFILNKAKVSLRTYIRIVISFVLFILLFQFMAIFAGRNTASLWNNFQIYFGSSIFAFSNYIKSPPAFEFFGRETLYGFLSALKALGFNIPTFTKHLEPTLVNNISTNIYTAIRRYNQDFTILGGLIVSIIISTFYGILYKLTKSNLNELTIMMFSIILIPLFEYAIEERVMNNLLTLEFFYLTLYVSIIYILLIKKKVNI